MVPPPWRQQFTWIEVWSWPKTRMIPKNTTELATPGRFEVLACTLMLVLCPILSFIALIALEHFGGALLPFLEILILAPRSLLKYLPPFKSDNTTVIFAYFMWIGFQVLLYRYLPGTLCKGQLTPAGHILTYRTNGMLAFVTSLVAAFVGCHYGGWPASIIADNWFQLVIIANIFGFVLSIAAYVKAYFKPSFSGDQKFRGDSIYDFFMGIELNPAIGWLDLKFFFNGRPGFIGWLLIDLSYVALQRQKYDSVSLSICIVTFLHSVYVIDFFLNEEWYLQTLDIAHDRYGFYLAWGSAVWLPVTYTLQAQYLARNPVKLSIPTGLFIIVIGLAGYFLFRSANDQRYKFRQSRGQCLIVGRKPEYLVAPFITEDGKFHESLLLCSGWWGCVRHANYTGDLILSFAMCATCGVQHILPWTYFIFMTIILLHRCERDEGRCLAKYGKVWEQYCKLVPHRLIPGVF